MPSKFPRNVGGLLSTGGAHRPQRLGATPTVVLVLRPKPRIDHDRPSMRRVASAFWVANRMREFRGNGYQVLSAASASEAIRLASDSGKHIDVLLTDVVMSQMDGRELSERILSLRPDLPVLYMSGYTDDEVLRRGVETSSISFIEKPIVPERLYEKLREVLDRSRKTRRGSRTNLPSAAARRRERTTNEDSRSMAGSPGRTFRSR